MASAAAIWFLREARDLLIQIALGILISYALEPVVAEHRTGDDPARGHAGVAQPPARDDVFDDLTRHRHHGGDRQDDPGGQALLDDRPDGDAAPDQH